ncbi:hypothetical protein HPB47_022130 [Ixodes persulcatus]|uniref:Uncharacterized protein n=1 Tax=Ixodes persulcatus TaxID=34615 RepID=A0AC60QAL0_IXOPE|nr:hypothetical protein HPB47_022130 [Ixodes persulcatus]
MSEYAKELRAVLAQMPDAESMVPGWFKNVDTLFASLSIPAEAHGAIILPFLTERMRAFSANQSDGWIMPYLELKEKILREVKMTANEYRRLFLTSQKTDGESWAQFSTKLETFFLYYLNSREIQTLDQLKHLMVSDRLKQVMPDEVRTYVLQNETSGWLRPKEVVQLAENFDESRRGRKRRTAHPFEGETGSRRRLRRRRLAVRDAARTERGRFVVLVVVEWDISRETVSNHEGKQTKVRGTKTNMTRENW